jgi:hypothetical protein
MDRGTDNQGQGFLSFLKFLDILVVKGLFAFFPELGLGERD